MPSRLRGPEPLDPLVRSAAQHVRDALPDSPPWTVLQTHELREADGRHYPLPLLVLARSGLYVVHVITRRGLLSGDDTVWRWDAGAHIEDAPYRAAQELADRVRDALRHVGARVRVEPLVLLASDGVSLDRDFVPHPSLTRRDDVDVSGVRSIVERLSADPEEPRHVVGAERGDEVLQKLAQARILEQKGRFVVGRFRLGELLEDHHIWQEHAAVATDDPTVRARVRTWVLPRVEDATHRAALQRAARNEAQVLAHVGQHPYILGLLDVVDQGDLPRLVFEGFDGATPLHLYLRAHPNLTFEHKLAILDQVADALDHCHRNDVLHRNLSPASVLVRQTTSGPEVRLHRFEGALAHAEATTLGTRHLSAFTGHMDEIYRAPEVFGDPHAATVRSDLFSLGALAYYLFVGKHPAPTLKDRAEQILEDDGLRLWRVRDDFDEALVELVAAATRQRPDQRRALNGHDEGVRDWMDRLLGLYTEPDAEHIVEPLHAGPGDLVAEDVRVKSVLGSGASSRVLRVDYDAQTFALKVPQGHAAQRLLDGEASVLADMAAAAPPGIIGFHGTLEIGGWRCLLLQDAGDATLLDLVRRQGALALDLVARLGDELLRVLSFLHERGITHRDLKPSNLAFTTTNRQAYRLLLFDFSLSAIDPRQVSAGTPGWRDPWLNQTRFEWDPHADLYSAAAVLHFALTGEKPVYDGAEVRVVETRFDPGLRGALAGFFRRAFEPDVSDRHEDAEAMRRAWADLFAGDITTVPPAGAGPADPRLERARLDTPIGALGLSARALNALERAAVLDVRDLLALPRNRLSAVRGVGRETSDEITAAADLLRDRLGDRDDARVAPFLPDLPGLPNRLDQVDLELPPDALAALLDAGLRTTRELADTGAERVARLLAPFPVDLDALRRHLRATAPDDPIQGRIGDWVAALLRPNTPSRRAQWEERVGATLGLDSIPGDTAPPGGRTNADTAQALGITPMVLRSSFQKARQHWDRRAAERDAARDAVLEVVDALGPVVSIEEAARALLERHAPALENDPVAEKQATALIRFATEVHVPRPPLSWRRLGRHAWVARDGEALDALTALAHAADRLADPAQPLTAEAASRALAPITRGTPLDALDPEALLRLAVQASDRAALSPRLELYARGLDPRRAVELAAALLTPGLDPQNIKRRVKARWPECGDLPDRPELDALLERVGLRWAADRKGYVRPGALAATGTATGVWPSSSVTTVGPRDVGVTRIDRFGDALKRSVEAGRFRVVQVAARRAGAAVEALRRAIPGLEVTSLDRLLVSGLDARIREAKADRDFVLEVDRAGPDGEHWPVFVEHFVRPVAEAAITDLLADRRRPRLVVDPGLLARYGLADLLDRLVRQGETGDGAALLMLVPSWDDGAHPVLRHPHGDLPVPLYLDAQRLRAPSAWIHQNLS